jgi:MerR family transcriptional regulator/heat shock protein HspR
MVKSAPARKKKARAGYMISAVAELYKLHPQTLRLYERVGLLKPSRSQGNTRLYTDSDLERLEVILTLTREMGVNLAGIEVVLNMREKMAEMQRQMETFASFVQQELARGMRKVAEPATKSALVRVPPPRVIRVHKPGPEKSSDKSSKENSSQAVASPDRSKP